MLRRPSTWYDLSMSDVTDTKGAPLDTSELAAVKEELRHARADLERFAYFVSHDFRAPLRHITAFSGLLENELADHENADVATWLGFLGSGARLIQVLVDAVLVYSRAQRDCGKAGKTVVATMFKEVQAAASEDGFTVVSDVGPEVVVAMSPHHADQVFAHLFQNALNFRKEDEPAHISLTSRSVANGDAWEITVHDKGSGVRQSEVEHVFDPFFRSGESPRESPGLGLTLARHLLSLYDGTITLESEYGAFTTVRVLLPAARATGEMARGERKETAKVAV